MTCTATTISTAEQGRSSTLAVNGIEIFQVVDRAVAAVDGVARDPIRVVADLERDAADRIVEQFKQVGAPLRVVPHGSMAFQVPAARGIVVTLASVIPEHKRVAINLVRELQGRGLRDAFRVVEKVLRSSSRVTSGGMRSTGRVRSTTNARSRSGSATTARTRAMASARASQ